MTTEVLFYFLNQFSMLPIVVLCCLPVAGHLRLPPKALLSAGIPALVLWAAVGTFGGLWLEWSATVWMAASTAAMIGLYMASVELEPWKILSVLTTVAALVIVCIHLSLAVDWFIPPESVLPLTLRNGRMFFPVCCVMLLALWRPAVGDARWLLCEADMPPMWHMIWLLPAAFTALLAMLLPLEAASLGTARKLVSYVLLVLALLGLLLLCCFLICRIARGLSENVRLQQENDLLQIESAQYEALTYSIQETRRMRHDLRHHIEALQSCVESGDLDGLERYLTMYRDSMTISLDEPGRFCKNHAVNAVLWFYTEKTAKAGVEFDASAQMGERAAVPEPELCVVLGNLLENALLACEGQDGGPCIRASIQQRDGAALTIAVDNPCPEPPVWEKGKLRSSRHAGFGQGTESVRLIAARYGGDARFLWENGEFCASVMLNP